MSKRAVIAKDERAAPQGAAPGAPAKRLVDILVERGLLTTQQVEQVRAEQGSSGQGFARLLLDRKLVTETQLVSALAEQLGMPFVDLERHPLDPAVAFLLPPAVAKRYVALPIAYEGDTILVAMADPGNLFAIDVIERVTRARIKPLVATRAQVLAAIDQLGTDEDQGGEAAPETVQILREQADDAPIVKLVNLLLQQAVHEGASDIYVEPQQRDILIQYRVRGEVHDLMRSPRTLQSALLSRLKLLAGLKVGDRTPQSGRVGLVIGGKAVDLHIDTVPTGLGEMAVIRIKRR